MADLTDAQRKSLASSDFAIPAKAPRSGSYPIPDLAHARNALARVAQNGSPAEQAQVRQAVYRKFPQLRPSTGGGAAMAKAAAAKR